MLKSHTSGLAMRERAATAGMAISASTRSQQVAEGGGIGELRGNARINGTGRQEHQAEVAQGVQQQDGQEDGAGLAVVQSGQHVEPGCDPEHQVLISRLTVRMFTEALPPMPLHPAGLRRRARPTLPTDIR